jgi:hypothetical protein
VFTGTLKIVHNHPTVTGQALHGSSMDDTQTSVTIVLSLEAIGPGDAIRDD